MFAITLTIVAILSLGSSNYEGYKVYKIFSKTKSDNQLLQTFELNSAFDFWSKINKVGQPVTVMATPEVQDSFENLLIDRHIVFSIEIDNVQRTVDLERDYHKAKQALPNGRITFDRYLRHSEINAFLTELAADNENLVTVTTIGRSYENRTVNIVRVSSGPTPKPILFIEAGNHAREWISPALAVYIINQLVQNKENLVLLDNLDWVILPVLNPDGYEFTWTSNRMWRKTRAPNVVCSGTDGNRNFDFHWREKGASDWECSETFAGQSAFSEVEARNLRDILNITEDIAGFVSLHSYGQYLFYPYSYDDIKAENWEELDRLAQQVNRVISAINGTQYAVGASTDLLYPAAGCTDDWAMGAAGIDVVLTFELPGGGPNGFDLPPDRILSVCSETWEGIKVIANYVAQKLK